MSATEIGPNGLEPRGAEGPAGARGRRVAPQVATIPVPRPSVEYATGPLLVSDAALAAAAASNAAAFAAIYRRYGDGLHAFCVGMLRDPDAAADCVHDVFVIAATRLAQLRERDKLRSWLYAIARHEALRRLRARRREEPSDTLPDTPEPGDGLEHDLAARERAELVRAACAGLSDRERAVFELHYRQGLDGPALAEALGVTPTNANTMVGRMRTTVERSLGALLVARHQAQRCPELSVVLRDSNWHGALTPLTRKRIARHIEHCPSCTRARGELVNPRALLASAPVAIPAPDWLRDKVLTDTAPLVESSAPAAAAGSVGGALGAGVAAGRSWWPAGLGVNTSTVVAVLAPVAAAVVAVPLVLIALADPDPSSAPTDAVAAAPAVGAPGQPTTPSRGRFSLEPSTTRYARPTEPSTLAPRSARPPSSVPTTLGGSAGPAPGPGGVVPTSRAQRKNGFGVPYRNQDPPTRETAPPMETEDDSVSATPLPTASPGGG